MKKRIMAFLAVIFSVAIMATLPVLANTTEQGGLESEIITNKEQYNSNETIDVEIKVKNTNAYSINDIKISSILPDGYQFADNANVTKTIDTLKAGMEVSVEVKITPITVNSPDNDTEQVVQNGNITENPIQNLDSKVYQPINIITGDNNHVVIWIMALMVSLALIGFFLYRKRKDIKKIISVFLCGIMTLLLIFCSLIQYDATVSAAIIDKSFTVTKEIKVNNESITLQGNISYKAIDNSDIINNSNTSREEWITYLVDTLNKNKVEFESYSFDDYDAVKNPTNIEAAIQNGFLELKPDEDNMVIFEPSEIATREFVAYTTIRALGYQPETTDVSTWGDGDSLQYAKEDQLAIKLGMFILNNNKFLPEEYISAQDIARVKDVIKQITDSEIIDNETMPEINYAEGVIPTSLSFKVDKNAQIVTIHGESDAVNWHEGEVHILNSNDKLENDLAIKIVSISTKDDVTTIKYSEPQLSEVVKDFEMEGTQSTQGELIPAQGVTIYDIPEELSNSDDYSIETLNNLAYEPDYLTDLYKINKLYSSSSGSVPLWGAKKISINIGDITGSVKLDMKDVEYRFAASPSWHIIDIDEVYLTINSSATFDIDLKKTLDEGEKSYKIADLNVPLGYGFNMSGEIKLKYTVEGTFEIEYSIDNKSGVQYTDQGGIRFINDTSTSGWNASLSVNAKAGLDIGPSVEFLGIDLVGVGANAGLAIDGKLNNVSVSPAEFCFDATVYAYCSIYCQIGPDSFNLTFEKEIMNSDNSVFRINAHFEEGGKVSECTRGYGDYGGTVLRADDTEVPIHHAKIEIYKDSELKDRTYTDSHGSYSGIKLPAGTYTIRVSASGYKAYQQSCDIVGGQTTTIQTQLMISNDIANDDNGDSFSCSGNITSALTGLGVEGVKVTVISQYYSSKLFGDENITDVVYTDNKGDYTFNAEPGKYLLRLSKEGYVNSDLNVTILFKDLNNINTSINPEGYSQGTLDSNNFRVVLTWGEIPRDLDSHLIGPKGNSSFHVYFINKFEPKVNLDVDDTSSYGPETVTVSETETGNYSYFVHDYTNGWSGKSNALSKSGATVQVFVGNTLKYTIHIPENKEGVTWQVFDFDSTSKKFSLINTVTYDYPSQK